MTTFNFVVHIVIARSNHNTFWQHIPYSDTCTVIEELLIHATQAVAEVGDVALGAHPRADPRGSQFAIINRVASCMQYYSFILPRRTECMPRTNFRWPSCARQLEPPL